MAGNEQLAALFREEASEHLAELETTLLELEQRPRDPDLISQAFRALHTLKGSGAMAGYDEADSLGRTVIIGLTNLTMTLVALALIDRVGRKALLMVGCVTFVIFHSLAAWVFFNQAHGLPANGLSPIHVIRFVRFDHKFHVVDQFS